MGRKNVPDKMSKTVCICEELRGLFHNYSAAGLSNSSRRGGLGDVEKHDWKGGQGPVNDSSWS